VSALIPDFTCLHSTGNTFAIVRGYHSLGQVDTNVIQNIRNALESGIAYVDVYMFPCVPCGNPAGQLQTLAEAISGEGYGMVWLDIERYAWSTDLSNNQKFISALITAGKALNLELGIFTSYINWQQIVGLDWTGASSLPLWYSHYNSLANFDDFIAFGGWSTPSIKQYWANHPQCGTDVDLNWYP